MRPLRAFMGALLVSAAAGCAHRPLTVAGPDFGRTEARYRAGLAAREVRQSSTLSEMSLWLETPSARYPGVRGTLRLAGPAALRLVIDSAFGVGLDAAAVDDSVYAYAPSRRAAVHAAAAEPPIGFRNAARFAVRAAAATWPVPAHAWRDGRAEDSLWVVRFREDADTLEIAAGESGLPRRVTLTRPGMRPVEVTYSGYTDRAGTAWPERIEVRDLGGAFRVSIRVRRMEEHANDAALRPAYPMTARRVAPDEVMRWFEFE